MRLRKDRLYVGHIAGFFVRYEWHVEAFFPKQKNSAYTIYGGEHRTLRSARKQVAEERGHIRDMRSTQRVRIRRVLVVRTGIVY